MGMWDDVNAPQYKPRLSGWDMLKMMVPIVGPIATIFQKEREREKFYKQYQEQEGAFPEGKDYSPDTLSGRIAQRMLERTGGETTIPGIMTATAIQRAAKDPENQQNFGNILMAASAQLAQKRPDVAAKLAMMAHQNFQTPWKPSEAKGTRMDSNTGIPLMADGTLKPNSTGYIKDDNVEEGDVTKSGYWVTKTDDKGQIAERNFITNAQGPRYKPGAVNVDLGNLGSLISDSDISKQIVDFGNGLNAYQDMSRSIGDIKTILKNNPNGGVTGWSGIVTEFVGKAANLGEFLGGLTTRFNDDGQSEAQVVGKFGGRLKELAARLPVNDQAAANSLVIQLAYAIARANNMGNASGGRGITDNDMEYAVRQLGAASTPEAFMKVLEETERRAAYSLRDRMRTTDTLIRAKDPSKSLPAEWRTQVDGFVNSFNTPPPSANGMDEETQKLIDKYLPKGP